MRQRLIGMAAMIACTLATFSVLATEYTPGVHYELITSEQPTNDPALIEVRELFWYGCPHCYDLEAEVDAWMKSKPANTSFTRQPAIPTKRWIPFAQVFYTAETLGILEQFHKPFFEALHKEKREFKTEKEIAAFFREQGVKESDFENAWKSFAVNTKVNRSSQLTRRYGITSVPTIVVNGKYRTNARLAGSQADIFKVVNFLIEQESKAAGKSTATAGN